MATVRAYEVLRKGGNPGKPILSRAEANDELVDRLVATKPTGERGFEWKRRGVRGEDAWKREPSGPALRRRLDGTKLQTGDAIYARRVGGRTVFVLRAVQTLAAEDIGACPDSSATAGVKAIWNVLPELIAEVERELGYDVRFVYQGIYNYRGINGAPVCVRPSQHAWRNALDGHLIRASTRQIDLRANDLLIAKIRARGIASEVLWRVSGHYLHWHLTGRPKIGGLPPGC
jgi:hypothetical protein